jgi:hypothetical protein
MTVSETLKKYWYVPVAIIGIPLLIYLILLILLMGVFPLIMNHPPYALIITELNDNETPNFLFVCCDEKGDFVQKTFLIPLTEEDFTQFPKLASIIRDKNQKNSYMDFNDRVTYKVDISNDEKYTIESHFPGGYLEYKGKRYNIVFMNVD